MCKILYAAHYTCPKVNPQRLPRGLTIKEETKLQNPQSASALGKDNGQPEYSLLQLVKYFLLLGATGFGGPIALVGYMHRDLVEEKRWISEEGYQEGLILAQVAPGPLAAQLSFYMGYIDYGLIGSALVGVAFVMPSFLMVVALGWAYT